MHSIMVYPKPLRPVHYKQFALPDDAHFHKVPHTSQAAGCVPVPQPEHGAVQAQPKVLRHLIFNT